MTTATSTEAGLEIASAIVYSSAPWHRPASASKLGTGETSRSPSTWQPTTPMCGLLQSLQATSRRFCEDHGAPTAQDRACTSLSRSTTFDGLPAASLAAEGPRVRVARFLLGERYP